MRPAGGYGATIWAHRSTGVDTTPWPLGPRGGCPSSSARATSSSSARRPSSPGLAVAGGGEEGGPDALGRARRAAARGWRGRRADEDQVGLAVGQVVEDGHGRTPSTSAALQVGGEDLARGSRCARMLCRATKPNLPGWVDAPATTTPAGLEQGAELRVGRPVLARRLGGARSRRPRPGRRRRPGAPSTTISGLRSADTMVGVGLGGDADRPSSTSASSSRSTAGSPRNAPSRAWVRSSSIISAASTRSIGTRRNATSARASARIAADAEHHGHAELRVAVEPGDELPVASHHRRHQQPRPSPSSGRGRGQQVGGGAPRPPPASPRSRRTRPRSVLWAMPVAVELGDDGEAELGRRRAGRRRRRPRSARWAMGTPCGRKERLGLGLGEGAGCRHGRAA